MQVRILDSVQEDLWAGRPVRKRILKARQMGCSTVVQAIMFTMAFLTENMRGLVVSHEQGSSEHLLSMNKSYWDTFFAKDAFTIKNVAANKLGWVENKALLTVTTAKSVQSARSRTIQFLHGSEVAFWDKPETLLTGLNQAVPRSSLSFIFQESTANGVGNWWHRACKSAEAHDDDFDFLFFGWWEHPEYQASFIGRSDLLEGPLIFIDDEERALYQFLKRKRLVDSVIHDKLMWRRSAIANECLGDIDKFHQEYPTTAEEAFVSTGRNIFPIAYLRGAYVPMIPDTGDLHPEPNGGVRFVPDPDGVRIPGPLAVYRYPGERGFASYVVGGDGGWTAGGDYACAQILNRDTWEQCAVWRDKTDANTFGEKLVLLGRWYNQALLVPEANRAGGATIGTIRARGYNNLFIHTKAANVRGMPDNMYGWSTNETTKQEVVSNMQKALYDAAQPHNRDRDIGVRIHDKATFEEMKNYVKLEGRGGFGNSDGTDHDDTVMAYGIGLTAIIHQSGLTLGGGSGEPAYDRLRLPKSPMVTLMEERFGALGVAEGAVMEEAGLRIPQPGHSPWLDDTGDMFGGNTTGDDWGDN